MGSDAALRCLPECGCLGGRGKPRCVTRWATDGGSSVDDGGRDRSTIERRSSTHVGELFSPRTSETRHSPARLVPSGDPVFTPATENARHLNFPEAQTSKHTRRSSFSTKSRWGGGYVPRAMNSILACLDTRMRSWSCVREKCTLNPAAGLPPAPRASKLY